MNDSVQFKDANGFVYVDSNNPLPVIISTASGSQPTTYEFPGVSANIPLPLQSPN